MAWNILELQRNTMEGIKDKDRCEGRRNNNSQFTGWDRFWSEVIFIGDAKVVVVKNQGERGWRNGTRRRRKDSSARRHHRREILEKKKELREIRFWFGAWSHTGKMKQGTWLQVIQQLITGSFSDQFSDRRGRSRNKASMSSKRWWLEETAIWALGGDCRVKGPILSWPISLSPAQ